MYKFFFLLYIVRLFLNFVDFIGIYENECLLMTLDFICDNADELSALLYDIYLKVRYKL